MTMTRKQIQRMVWKLEKRIQRGTASTDDIIVHCMWRKALKYYGRG
jgi:hypothetical protein